MQESLYYDRSIVREKEMFFGREELLQDIFLSCINRQCFSLVGKRSSGKSSLLTYMQMPEIQERAGLYKQLQHFLFVYIDMRSYVAHTSDAFFRELYELIGARVPGTLALRVEGSQGTELFKNILSELRKEQYYVVLLMDTFDKIEKAQQFGPNVFSFLRAPAAQGQISYVTASIKPLYRIAPDQADSPFFSNFKVGYVKGLTQDEALQLITIPSTRAGQPFSTQERTWILEQAGRHPFFIQVTCQHLFEAKRKLQEGQNLDLQKLRQTIYEELRTHFDSIWKDLSHVDQRDLNYEARQVSGVERKVEELSESYLFRKYVIEVCKVQQVALASEDVKAALEHYNDRPFLENTVLANMQYVATREEAEKNVVHKRGYLVQQFLKDAFERIKPGGTPSDVASEWRSYNILSLRFFRHTVNHDQIAARLGVSRRQYFRDLDKAFLALRDALLDLDAESFT